MTKTAIMRFALLSTVAARAFEGAGWKKDADGKLVLDGDGNPIYVNAAGQEQSVKHDTITNLNAEAKQHRTTAEQQIAIVNKYKGADGKLIDPDAAAKAIETVSKIDAKSLIDAGKVDELKEQMRTEFTGQLQEKDKRITELDTNYRTVLVDRAFEGSDFVRDRLAVPRDIFRDSFGKNVKVNDEGKIEYYGRDGNRLLSKKTAGEYATGDEAFELMVEQHPQKDMLIKAQQSGGSGNGGGGGSRGANGKTVRRSDFNAMAPAEQAQIGQQAGKGEIQIVDD